MQSRENGSESVKLQGSDTTMGKLVASRSKYTDDQRRQAVVEYCVSGLMTKVSDSTGIPETTLATWKNKTDWWDDLVVAVRSEINEVILAQNLQIATKAGERVLDSLENGDEKLVWDKEKKEHVIKRVKPGAYHSMLVSGISQDKARVQQSLPTSITGKAENMTSLAKQFDALAQSFKEKQVNVVAVQEESEELE